MRLFLALELPHAVKRQLFLAGARLLEVQWGLTDPVYKSVFRLNYTREGNLHVTLKFLGEVPEQHAPKVCDALRRVDSTGEIALRTQGLEFFPDRGPIHVIAAKVGGDTDRILELHREVERTCSALGFERDRRPYRPHVTLIRSNNGIPAHLREGYYFKSAKEVEVCLVPAFAASPEFLVGEFVLLESRLHGRQGPEYVPLARFSLDPHRRTARVDGA
jgi:2'-5' RNA ligase